MMRKLFDKKFVHFMWDDSLEGKELFLSNNIDSLICNVNSNNKEFCRQITQVDFEDWTFAYYDPNYECKRAYNEGKQIQVKHAKWIDVDEPKWFDDEEYRIKP